MEQTTAIQLLQVNGEYRIDSRIIATGLNIEHKAMMQLIQTHKTRLETFGFVPFEMEKITEGRGRKTKYAMLNRNQAIALGMLARNTDEAADFKIAVVVAFDQALTQLQQELPPLGPVDEFSQMLDGLFRGDADALDIINAKKLILGVLWMQQMQDVLFPDVPHKTLKESLAGAIQTICEAQEEANLQLTSPKRKRNKGANHV